MGSLIEGITSQDVPVQLLNDSSFKFARSRPARLLQVWDWRDLVSREEQVEIADLSLGDAEVRLRGFGIDSPRKFCFPEWHYRQIMPSYLNLYRQAVLANLIAVRFLDASAPTHFVQPVGAELVRLALRRQAHIRGTSHLWLAATPFTNQTALDYGDYGDWWTKPISTDVVTDSVTTNPPHRPLNDLPSGNHLYLVAAALRRAKSIAVEGIPPELLPNPLVTVPGFARRRIRRLTQRRLFVDETGMANSSRQVVFLPFHDPRDSQVTVVGREFFDQTALAEFLVTSLPAGVDLVVKPHPAAMGDMPTRELRYLSRLGVSVVSPAVPVDRILRHTDVCLVINSTVGFDAILRGVPVVSLATSFYRGRGWTRDVDNAVDAVEAILELLASADGPSPVPDLSELTAALIAGTYSAKAELLGKSLANALRALPTPE